MTVESFHNISVTTLAFSYTNADLVLTVVDGSVLPSTSSGENFHCIIENEIILVTSRSANSLTVLRGREGTSAAAHAAGTTVAAVLTQEALEKFVQEGQSSRIDHASISGVTDSQHHAM